MKRWFSLRNLLIVLVASLFAVSFYESWEALTHAATEAKIPDPRPWPWQVDGFIVVMGLIVVEAKRNARGNAVWWPRLGMIAATILSTGIQIAYAPPGVEWYDRGLAAWSPIAVYFSFECLVWLLWGATENKTEAPVEAPEAVLTRPLAPPAPPATPDVPAREHATEQAGTLTLEKKHQQALDNARRRGGAVEVERVMVARGLDRSLVAERPQRWPLPSQNGEHR